MSPQDHRDPDALDDLDSETIEDLDVGDAAEEVEGGYDLSLVACTFVCTVQCHTL